jgi:ADP-heptose:LPS heptosyltransferase
MRTGEHAVDYYGRCIGAALDTSVHQKVLAVDREWAADFVARHDLATGSWLLVHPGSGAERKNWRGFGDLARGCRARFGRRVVAVHGPVEEQSEGNADIVVRDLSLPQVAALLAVCPIYVGNDSGISHLAGVVGSCGVVLFGPSDPSTWAPRGRRLSVLHAPAACDRCGPLVFCTHRLAVASVLDALGKCIEEQISETA